MAAAHGALWYLEVLGDFDLAESVSMNEADDLEVSGFQLGQR